jgi:hypothetical protein
MFKILTIGLLLIAGLTGSGIGMAANEESPEFIQYEERMKSRLENELHLVGKGHVCIHIFLNQAGELKEQLPLFHNPARKNITDAVLACQPYGIIPLDGYNPTDLIQFDIVITWSILKGRQLQNVEVALTHFE